MQHNSVLVKVCNEGNGRCIRKFTFPVKENENLSTTVSYEIGKPTGLNSYKYLVNVIKTATHESIKNAPMSQGQFQAADINSRISGSWGQECLQAEQL